MSVTVALVAHVKPARPDDRLLRRALRTWAFNTKIRGEAMPATVTEVLAWVRRNCGNVSAFAKPDTLRTALDSLATNLDGKPAAPNYFIDDEASFTTLSSTRSNFESLMPIPWPR